MAREVWVEGRGKVEERGRGEMGRGGRQNSRHHLFRGGLTPLGRPERGRRAPKGIISLIKAPLAPGVGVDGTTEIAPSEAPTSHRREERVECVVAAHAIKGIHTCPGEDTR